MARTFQRRERMSAMSEINVTPLIDLAFALLIIFIIATPLLEQTIPIQLPLEMQKPQQQDAPNFQSISISADARYYWGEQEVGYEELEVLLGELSTRADPPVLNIRADRDLRYQEVVTVIDLVKQNNLTRISLDTQAQ